jgi:hypothetical protein
MVDLVFGGADAEQPWCSDGGVRHPRREQLLDVRFAGRRERWGIGNGVETKAIASATSAVVASVNGIRPPTASDIRAGSSNIGWRGSRRGITGSIGSDAEVGARGSHFSVRLAGIGLASSRHT